MELDWRELDPFLRQLQDCASFWTLINLSADIVYSGLIILLIFLQPDPDSPFFQGIQSHVNPVLMYLIPSLIVNYGGVMSNQMSYERCFLLFSVLKGFLFPLTFGSFLYLILSDVRAYFGDFWVSFVVLLACYNGIAVLALWSMYICNKYIYINEAAQKRHRLLANRNSNLLLGRGGGVQLPTTRSSSYGIIKVDMDTCTCNQCKVNRRQKSMMLNGEFDYEGGDDEEEFLYSSVWTIDSHSVYQQWDNYYDDMDDDDEENNPGRELLDTWSVANHFQRVFLGSIDDSIDISNVQITL